MKKQSSVIIGFLLVLIIVVFAVLNNRNVPVNFGIASFSAPLILVIIGSAIIGALIVFVFIHVGLPDDNHIFGFGIGNSCRIKDWLVVIEHF